MQQAELPFDWPMQHVAGEAQRPRDVDEALQVAALRSCVHGLLTAAVVGPEFISPRECMAALRGEDGFDAPEEQVEAGCAALASMGEAIAAELADDEFEPLFCETDAGETRVEDWCYGFMLGVSLRVDVWKPFLLSRKSGDAFLPIYANLPADCAFVDGAADLSEALESFRTMPELLIPISVNVAHEYWMRRRSGNGARAARSSARAQVGRNAPCPCGSGAKYKKCCGA